jgi:hypothetical protein
MISSRNRQAAKVIVMGFIALSFTGVAVSEDLPGYGGCKAPGRTPELFAPGLISTDAFEFAVTFTPDMRELYFTRREESGPNRILVSHLTDEGLQAPVSPSFGGSRGEFEPCISPDGSSIFFGHGDQIKECTRQGGSWSAPRSLSPEVNRDGAMAICVDTAGNFYFTRRGGLLVVRSHRGGYHEAEAISPHLQPPGGDAAHGFVAPDGGYIIFDSQGRDDVKGRADLYISFNNGDGSWTEPKNMTNLNTPVTEMCPSVTPDGRFLLFCRQGDIFWVDASVIEEYR